MSITLKNITAADTISSMVDKINFNFDQLLLNGGGIEGPRGVEGYPGMQGIQGEKGNTGSRGEKGERGVHFHLLDRYGSDESAIEYALEHGLDDTDPEGDEYQDGDMIIALIPVSSNGDANYTDSIWRVEERQDNFYPVNTNIIFSQTTFFEELIVGQTNNTLLRTKFDDSNNKRGIVLNDYNHRILDGSGADPATITDSMINSIIENNIVLVYTEALSQSGSEGSPNCGIVFYKNGETTSELGDFPRINYVISPNAVIDHINYFNIIAPQQGLHLIAKDNIFINSIEGNIVIKSTEETSEISIERNDNKVIISKKEGDINELHLIGDEIFIEKENVSSERWLKIRNKDYSNVNECEIILCKDYTFVQSDGFFSIGKTGVEVQNGENEEEYFDQARINVINGDDPEVDVIAPEIFLGKNPDEETCGNYGIAVKASDIKISSSDSYYDSGTGTDICDTAKIELNTENIHKASVAIHTSYPGVTQISNMSERYIASIINYTDDSFDMSETGTYKDYRVYAAPMGDAITKSGRYNYANMNCYENMNIRNINNMGAVHAGSIIFNGRYGTTDTVYDTLTYDFIRIGNVVHCSFHGIINTNKICARVLPNEVTTINKGNLSDYGETYFKSGNDLLVNWPTSNSISSKLPTYMSAQKQPTTLSDVSTLSLARTTSLSTSKSFLPVMSLVSLNKIYLNLYPPIIKITHSNYGFKTNVSDFVGHLIYSAGGSVYEKELVYNDEITTNSKNSLLKKIPAIAIRDMKNSSTAKVIATGDTSTAFTIAGSSTANTLVEINGYFSYVLHCNSSDMHTKDGSNIGSFATITDANGNIRYTSGNTVAVNPVTIIETPINIGDAPEEEELLPEAPADDFLGL